MLTNNSTTGDAVASEYEAALSTARLNLVIPFISKLFLMLEDPSCQELVHWRDGTSFQVTNAEKFAKKVCPRYFKHNTYASFIRQLNMYGFRKMNSVQEPGCAGVFAHPQFIRNRPELLSDIRRKSASHRKSIEFETSESLSPPCPSTSIVATAMTSPPTSVVTHPIRLEHPVVMPATTPLETLGFVSRIEQRLGNNAAATKEMQESLEVLWGETKQLRQIVQEQAQKIQTLSDTVYKMQGAQKVERKSNNVHDLLNAPSIENISKDFRSENTINAPWSKLPVPSQKYPTEVSKVNKTPLFTLPSSDVE